MIFLIINNLTFFEAWPIHVTGRQCPPWLMLLCWVCGYCQTQEKGCWWGGIQRPEMDGLWGEGHMNSVEIHRPLHAGILAKALSCLQNANEQVRWDVKGRQPEPRMIYLRTWWRKHGWHHVRMQGETQKTFQRRWGIFQKSKAGSFGREGNC